MEVEEVMEVVARDLAVMAVAWEAEEEMEVAVMAVAWETGSRRAFALVTLKSHLSNEGVQPNSWQYSLKCRL